MITYRPKSLILIISHTQSHLHTYHHHHHLHRHNPFYLEAKKLKRQRDRHRRFHLNPNPHPRLLPPPSSSLPPPPPPPPPPPRSEMAIEPAEKVPLILTSGASGRISALLSPRSLKSLVSVFVNALFLLLLLPFRGRKRCVSNSTHPAAPNREKLLLQPRNDNCKGASVVVPRRSAPARDDDDVASRRALAIRGVIQDEDKDTFRDFSLFLTGRGDTMFTQSWTPVSINIRGVVVLLHGLNEHSGRYDDFAKLLNTNGYKVYGMDWIGHGGSDGLHAYVHSLDDAVADMKIFLKMVVAENPGLPCFCFGHSTGGAIVIKAALDPKVEACIAGIVITSPAIGVQPSHPIYAVVAPVVSFLLPRYQFNAANKKGAVVSRDPEALVSKYSDPLVYTGGIRVRTGYEILRISSYLQRNLSRLRIPFLVLHGSADCVTDPEFSQKLYREASSADKTFKLLEGLLHDLLIEPEREEIMKDIIEWLNSK